MTKKKVKKNISKADMQKKAVKKSSRPAHHTSKKTAKKTSKPKAVKAEKPKKASSEKKDKTGTYALIAAVIGLALIGYFLWTYDPMVDNAVINSSSEETVLANVNGEDITQAEIEAILSRIPEANKAQYTQESILDQLITEKVLLQKAEELGIEVNESEIDEFVQLIMSTNQLDEQGLEARLSAQGLGMDDLRDEIEKQVKLTKLVDREIEVDNLTDAELEEYYNENIEFFVSSPEQVNASHILVCYNGSPSGCDENRTQIEAEERADEILAMITDDNFAEIATEYSDGPSASRGGNLGFFSKGQMVPEFEEVAFSIEEGEVSEPVFTQFGYHIIKVFDKQEEEIAEFEQVKDTIKSQLEQEMKQSEFQDYVDELRAEAEIDYNN